MPRLRHDAAFRSPCNRGAGCMARLSEWPASWPRPALPSPRASSQFVPHPDQPFALPARVHGDSQAEEETTTDGACSIRACTLRTGQVSGLLPYGIPLFAHRRVTVRPSFPRCNSPGPIASPTTSRFPLGCRSSRLGRGRFQYLRFRRSTRPNKLKAEGREGYLWTPQDRSLNYVATPQVSKHYRKFRANVIGIGILHGFTKQLQ